MYRWLKINGGLSRVMFNIVCVKYNINITHIKPKEDTFFGIISFVNSFRIFTIGTQEEVRSCSKD